MKNLIENIISWLKKQMLFLWIIGVIGSWTFVVFNSALIDSLLKMLHYQDRNKFIRDFSVAMGAVLTLVVQYFRAKTHDLQANISNKQVQELAKQVSIQSRTQQDEQFKKAVDFLSDPESTFASKAGAVFILGALGRDSYAHAQQCLDMLCELNRWMGERLIRNPDYFDKFKIKWKDRVVLINDKSLLDFYNGYLKSDKADQIDKLNDELEKETKRQLEQEELSRLVLDKVVNIIRQHCHQERPSDKVSELSLRGKYLCQINLNGVHLKQRVDFSNANLVGSELNFAQLQNADLSFAELKRCFLYGASLQDANLQHSQLQGADLHRSKLQGASLIFAQLQEANLRRAQLQGARLAGAQLQGADLTGAQLGGASLMAAQLQRANLFEANLHLANLESAQLQGANLRVTQLQGINLNNAQLQGADLTGARLQGAYLKYTNFQGADLYRASLIGSFLNISQFQGANLSGTEFQGAVLIGTQFQGIFTTKYERGDEERTFKEIFDPSRASEDFKNWQLGTLTKEMVNETISDMKKKGSPKEFIKEVRRRLTINIGNSANLIDVRFGYIDKEESEIMLKACEKSMSK
jgi:uncharacterized protein YjbI with pentapeptide repeats